MSEKYQTGQVWANDQYTCVVSDCDDFVTIVNKKAITVVVYSLCFLGESSTDIHTELELDEYLTNENFRHIFTIVVPS